MWLSDSKNKQQQKYFSQQEILHPAQAHKHIHANTRTNSWYIDWKMHTKNSKIGTLIVVLEMVCCVGLTRKATWNGNLVIFFFCSSPFNEIHFRWDLFLLHFQYSSSVNSSIWHRYLETHIRRTNLSTDFPCKLFRKSFIRLKLIWNGA